MAATPATPKRRFDYPQFTGFLLYQSSHQFMAPNDIPTDSVLCLRYWKVYRWKVNNHFCKFGLLVCVR